MLALLDESQWRLEPDDRFVQPTAGPWRDYILSDYEPRADPRGRLHSSSLLRYFLRAYGLLELWPIVTHVRTLVGADETVWGAKCWAESPGAMLRHAGIELYFYNRTRNAPGNPKSVSRLVGGLAPELRIDSRVDEALPYMMCSLELDAGILRAPQSPGFRIYVAGDRRKQGYDGVSYLVQGSTLVRENLYQFYRAPSEETEFRARLAESVHATQAESRQRLAPEEFSDCFTFCFSQKRFSDAVYFSRIDTGRLAAFLATHMPGPLPRVLELEAPQFAHLSWDVGLDFASPDGGRTSHVVKVGFYGFF